MDAALLPTISEKQTIFHESEGFLFVICIEKSTVDVQCNHKNLNNTTLTTKRPRKVATTIGLDPELKAWVRKYAEFAGIDLSTFITITLTQVKHSGAPTQMYDPKLVAYNKYLDDMIARIDSEEELTTGPFHTKEEISTHLTSLMK